MTGYRRHPQELRIRFDIEKLIDAEDVDGLLRYARTTCACRGPVAGETECPCNLYGPPGRFVGEVISLAALRRGKIVRLK